MMKKENIIQICRHYSLSRTGSKKTVARRNDNAISTKKRHYERGTSEVISTNKEQIVSPASRNDGKDKQIISLPLPEAGSGQVIMTNNNYSFYEVKPDKMPIAIYNRMNNFTTHKIQLAKGDQLYMSSDGFADQFGGPKGKKFKYKPFKQLLIDNCELSMVEQKNILEKTFDEWKGNLEQVDDITVVGIRI